MALNARSIARHGIGFAAIAVATQGLITPADLAILPRPRAAVVHVVATADSSLVFARGSVSLRPTLDPVANQPTPTASVSVSTDTAAVVDARAGASAATSRGATAGAAVTLDRARGTTTKADAEASTENEDKATTA